VTAFSLATFLAAVNVKYRDVQLVVPMLIQILFFASPVLYPGTLVGDTSGHAWSYIYSINPMASVLDGMRWALIDGQPYPGTANILISVGSAALLLVGSLLYFRRAENFFADVI
jgi:ABC-type polysaccharide/polyol phosphate export permease